MDCSWDCCALHFFDTGSIEAIEMASEKIGKGIGFYGNTHENLYGHGMEFLVDKWTALGTAVRYLHSILVRLKLSYRRMSFLLLSAF